MRQKKRVSLQNAGHEKFVEYFVLTGVMETKTVDIPIPSVDITDVENSVETVENPLDSRKITVENSVEEVEKKLHRGRQT